MEDFDRQYVRIMKKQRLVQQGLGEDIVDGAKNLGAKAWEGIKGVSQKVVNFFKSLWSSFTRENAQQTSQQTQRLVKKFLPAGVQQKIDRGVQAFQSPQFQEYKNGRVAEEYGDGKWEDLPDAQKKQKIQQYFSDYGKQNNIISQGIICQFWITFTIVTIILMITGTTCFKVIDNTAGITDVGKANKQEKAEKIRQQNKDTARKNQLENLRKDQQLQQIKDQAAQGQQDAAFKDCAMLQ